MNRLKSRKLWLSLIASAVAFGNSYWCWGLTLEEVQTVMIPLLAFIGVEGAADYKSRKNGARVI